MKGRRWYKVAECYGFLQAEAECQKWLKRGYLARVKDQGYYLSVLVLAVKGSLSCKEEWEMRERTNNFLDSLIRKQKKEGRQS